MREIENIHQTRPPFEEAQEIDASYTPIQEDVHLRDYFKILLKRRRLIVTIVLGFVVTGAYFNFTATKVYNAASLLNIEPITPSVTSVGEMNRSMQGGGEYYETQYALLRSRALAARVITDLKLDSDKTFRSAWITSANPISRINSTIFGTLNSLIAPIAQFFAEPSQNTISEPPPEPQPVQDRAAAAQTPAVKKPPVSSGLIGRYLSFLQVLPVKNTRLVQIAFVTPDPGLSQKLADAHAKGFIRMNLENRFQLTKEAREFLDAKNDELKKKLERSEADLNRFRQTHGVVSIDKGENIVVDRLMELNRQLTTARAQRLEAESLNSVVEGKSTQYLSQVLTQGMIPALRSNLLGLEAEKIRQSTVFKPDHPRMMELNQQINQVKQSLNAEITNVLRGIRENYVAARAKEQALENEAQKQQRMALALKEVGVQYAVLQEEVNVNKNLYDTILRRLNETNISNDIAVSNMQIVQTAERPGGPSAPNVPLSLVTYAFIGLFVGIGLAIFLSYMDSHLDSPELISRAIDLNTIGLVPDLRSVKRSLIKPATVPSLRFLTDRQSKRQLPGRTPNGKELILSYHPLSVFSEAYRNIRTNLLLSSPEASRKVILITSPSPGEGKTATALNLGIAWAQDGFRVLIIDADMRRGSCHTRLGVTNHLGLSNVLAARTSLEGAVLSTAIRGLSLLPCGPCPANPSGLLSTGRMASLLMQVRKSFDFILIDSPPALAISDPVALSNVSDGILLVFHPKKTTMDIARRVKERLDAVRAPVLGVILNGINLGDPNYVYYRDYYGSGYGSGSVVHTATGAANNGHGDRKVDLQNLVAEDRLKKNGNAVAPESTTVPEEFINRMAYNLAAAVGPIAAVLVRDHISRLGESKSAFPKNRVGELCDRLCEEILDSRLRNEFHAHTLEELTTI
jgi:capsular exopolysaccharide synthesis family protein